MATWWQVDFIEPFLPQSNGPVVIFTGIDTQFCICIVSDSTRHLSLTKYMIYELGMSHNIASDNETHFIARELWD